LILRFLTIGADQFSGGGSLGHFDMGRAAMDTYYRPLETRVAEMEAGLEGSRVLGDLRAELAAYHACDGIVSFEMFVLQTP